jgi:threonine dehydratase
VFVPVGGGGLICGVAAALKGPCPRVRLVGVQAANSPFLHAYFHGADMNGVVERPTLADGLAGTVEAGAVTLELVRALVDDFLLVDEPAIEDAIRWADQRLGEVIEPSAAAALAASLGQPETGRRLVILSGGNIAPSLLARVRGESVRDA